MSPSANCIVVMTACINPGQDKDVHRSDPNVRLNDYLDAMRFWLHLPDPRIKGILLTENSYWPLDAFRTLADSDNPHGRAVELNHFWNNDLPKNMGYGFPELGMLDEAARKSPMWKGAQYLMKVTGRLRFPHVSRLLDRTPDDTRLMVDARDRKLPSKRSADHGSLTTQLMIFTPDFYQQHMLDVRTTMRPVPGWRLIENVLFRQLFPLQHEPGVYFRFPVNCSPYGLAGGWNKSYDSLGNRTKDKFRAVSRVLLPWWWI